METNSRKAFKIFFFAKVKMYEFVLCLNKKEKVKNVLHLEK